jgi:hypothetical protein
MKHIHVVLVLVVILNFTAYNIISVVFSWVEQGQSASPP